MVSQARQDDPPLKPKSYGLGPFDPLFNGHGLGKLLAVFGLGAAGAVGMTGESGLGEAAVVGIGLGGNGLGGFMFDQAVFLGENWILNSVFNRVAANSNGFQGLQSDEKALFERHAKPVVSALGVLSRQLKAHAGNPKIEKLSQAFPHVQDFGGHVRLPDEKTIEKIRDALRVQLHEDRFPDPQEKKEAVKLFDAVLNACNQLGNEQVRANFRNAMQRPGFAQTAKEIYEGIAGSAVFEEAAHAAASAHTAGAVANEGEKASARFLSKLGRTYAESGAVRKGGMVFAAISAPAIVTYCAAHVIDHWRGAGKEGASDAQASHADRLKMAENLAGAVAGIGLAAAAINGFKAEGGLIR